MVRESVACGHIYHPGCIERWLTVKDECPICKAQLGVYRYMDFFVEPEIPQMPQMQEFPPQENAGPEVELDDLEMREPHRGAIELINNVSEESDDDPDDLDEYEFPSPNAVSERGEIQMADLPNETGLNDIESAPSIMTEMQELSALQERSKSPNLPESNDNH